MRGSSSSERVLLSSFFFCSVLIGTPLPWGETWTFLPDLARVFGGENARSNREPFRLSISTVTLRVICSLAGGGSAVPLGNGGPIFLRSTAASRFLWADRSDQTVFVIIRFYHGQLDRQTYLCEFANDGSKLPLTLTSELCFLVLVLRISGSLSCSQLYCGSIWPSDH